VHSAAEAHGRRNCVVWPPLRASYSTSIEVSLEKYFYFFSFSGVCVVAFKVYDMDRDGYISNGELFLVLKMMVGNNLKVPLHRPLPPLSGFSR
jgi:hypothetical protein